MQTGNKDFIYRNELDKACCQHDMAYGKSKNKKELNQKKFLEIKHFNLRVIQNMMVTKEDLLQWLLNFLVKYLVEAVFLMN